jgi:hypothetical protein
VVTTARGLLPPLQGVDDLAGAGHVLDPRELHPFHVTDHRDLHPSHLGVAVRLTYR